MFYRTNLFRKDNPGWPISNATETIKVPGPAFYMVATIGGRVTGIPAITGRVRSGCGICVSWLLGVPRRAGRRWYQVNDAEAGWRGWQVTERYGGLGRQYRDARFDALRLDPSLRRDELGSDELGSDQAASGSATPGRAAPAQPECPCPGDLL
jgi:hypothetical protein